MVQLGFAEAVAIHVKWPPHLQCLQFLNIFSKILEKRWIQFLFFLIFLFSFLFYFFFVFFYQSTVSASLPNDELTFWQNDVNNTLTIIIKDGSNDIKSIRCWCYSFVCWHQNVISSWPSYIIGCEGAFYLIAKNYWDYKNIYKKENKNYQDSKFYDIP